MKSIDLIIYRLYTFKTQTRWELLRNFSGTPRELKSIIDRLKDAGMIEEIDGRLFIIPSVHKDLEYIFTHKQQPPKQSEHAPDCSGGECNCM